MKTNTENKTVMNNEVVITLTGEHISGNCKAVICIEDGRRWSSQIDCAKELGAACSSVSAACTGKIKTVKGLHLAFASRSLESLDSVLDRLQEASKFEADAMKWRAQQDEIKKKEEEKKSLIEKFDKATEAYNKTCVKVDEAMAKKASAYNEVERLRWLLKDFDEKNN